MAIYMYRNNQMEQDLLDKINDSAHKHYAGGIPPEAQERIAMEIRNITDNGHGTQLAITAALAEYSADHGYPVGIRGHIGDLLIAHLLGIAALDPMELGLHWEGCLGLDGSQMQEITLNVAPELSNGLRAYLRELLPDCDVLFGPGVPGKRTIIVPRDSGPYNPDVEYLSITLCPHELMSRVGQVRRRADGMIAFDEDLIVSTYRTDAEDIPLLGDWGDFRDPASLLEPRSFPELVKVIGLALAWKVQFQAYRTPLLPDRFEHLVGTQEDIYDICVRLGINGGDAFCIMQQAVDGKLAQEYKDMLAAKGVSELFLETLDNAYQLIPRGQLADEIYWALTLLTHRSRTCRV